MGNLSRFARRRLQSVWSSSEKYCGYSAHKNILGEMYTHVANVPSPLPREITRFVSRNFVRKATEVSHDDEEESAAKNERYKHFLFPSSAAQKRVTKNLFFPGFRYGKSCVSSPNAPKKPCPSPQCMYQGFFWAFPPPQK